MVAHAGECAQALIHVALAGQGGLHPGDQLALVHRLGEHVVGAVLEELHASLADKPTGPAHLVSGGAGPDERDGTERYERGAAGGGWRNGVWQVPQA